MQTTPTLPNVRSSERIAHAVELLVFVFLIAPSLVLPMFVRSVASVPFTLAAVATILRDLALVALVLFFLWRNAEPLTTIGWTRRALTREVIVGLMCFLPTSGAAAALEIALRRMGLSGPSGVPPLPPPTTATQYVIAVVLVFVVALAEETIFRGYVLARLREWTHHTSWSIVLSAALFAVGHAYEGSAGVITVGVLGVVFALVYLWRRSLVAPMTMHFCQDFVAIALAPALGHHA